MHPSIRGRAPTRHADDKRLQPGQLQRVKRRERPRVAEPERLRIEPDLERAQRADDAALGHARVLGGQREREVREAAAAAQELRVGGAVEREVREVCEERAGDALCAPERHVPQARGGHAHGCGCGCGVAAGVERERDGAQGGQAACGAEKALEVGPADVHAQVAKVRAVRERELEHVGARGVAPEIGAGRRGDADAQRARVRAGEPALEHVEFEFVVPHAAVVQGDGRPELGGAVCDGAPATTNVREDERRRACAWHHVRRVR